MHTTRFIIPSAHQYKKLDPFMFDFLYATDKDPAIIKVDNTGPFAITFDALMEAVVSMGKLQGIRVMTDQIT